MSTRESFKIRELHSTPTNETDHHALNNFFRGSQFDTQEGECLRDTLLKNPDSLVATGINAAVTKQRFVVGALLAVKDGWYSRLSPGIEALLPTKHQIFLLPEDEASMSSTIIRPLGVIVRPDYDPETIARWLFDEFNERLVRRGVVTIDRRLPLHEFLIEPKPKQ